MLDKTFSLLQAMQAEPGSWHQHTELYDGAMSEVKALRTLPRIICLCGSTRFRDAILNASERLTLEGNIVLAPNVFGREADDEGKPGDALLVSDTQKGLLDALHFRKIDLADQVHVVNIGGYIGRSTHNEVKYAVEHGKLVSFTEDRVIPWSDRERVPQAVSTRHYLGGIRQSLAGRKEFA